MKSPRATRNLLNRARKRAEEKSKVNGFLRLFRERLYMDYGTMCLLCEVIEIRNGGQPR